MEHFSYTCCYTINWKVGLTKKKSCRNATIVLSILIKNRIDPLIFSISELGLSRYLRSKEANMQKSWNLAKQKKNSIYQLFKTRICAFMTYVQFLPKRSSNLRSMTYVQFRPKRSSNLRSVV